MADRNERVDVSFDEDADLFILAYLNDLALQEVELRVVADRGDLNEFAWRRQRLITEQRAFDDVWRAFVLKRASQLKIRTVSPPPSQVSGTVE